MKNLQPLIDELLNSESGAELIADGDEELGAVADMVYSKETNQVAYKLLGPWAAMVFDRTFVFPLKDSTVQKDKNRLVMRSTGGNIYVLQPTQTDSATSTSAHFELNEEQKKQLREGLKIFVAS